MVGQASAQCHLLCPLQDSALFVGQAILPAAAFLGGFSGDAGVFAPGKGRLKADCSQDWLPHNLRRMVAGVQSKWHWASACQRPLCGRSLEGRRQAEESAVLLGYKKVNF
jgi:hypothetical protein